MPEIILDLSKAETNPATLGYTPTPLEKHAADRIDELFNASKKAWSEPHKLHRRLWTKYKNYKQTEKSTGYSNIQTGKAFYIIDIRHSILKGAILRQSPLGKISATGVEDFPGKEAIDAVHAWQTGSMPIKIADEDALLYSEVCGTGIEIPGWDYELQTFTAKEPVTVKMANPADPFGMPMEMPTGENREVEREERLDQFRLEVIPPWRMFPTAGCKNINDAPHKMYLVPSTKTEILNYQKTGYFKNVEYIEETAYGFHDEDADLDETKIRAAQKTDQNKEHDKETIWLIYFYGQYPLLQFESHDAGKLDSTPDDVPSFIVKPLHSKVILKVDKRRLPSDPCIVWKSCGPDDEPWGISPLQIAEQLLLHDKNMFDLEFDAGKRETQRRTYVPKENFDQSQMAAAKPDALVELPNDMMMVGKGPYQDPMNPHLMPNLAANRVTTNQLIDEITAVVDFIKGISEPDETATQTTQRANFLNERFRGRMEYYEKRALWWRMQWQVVMNYYCLTDKVVAQVTGRNIWPNPFMIITPTLPIKTFDFVFEGSAKASDDPVQVQQLIRLLEIGVGLPPGMDETGQFVKVNPMAIYRDIVRKTDATQDMEKYFMPVTPMDMMAGLPGGGASGGLGATTPGDLLASTGVPSKNMGIKQEAA